MGLLHRTKSSLYPHFFPPKFCFTQSIFKLWNQIRVNQPEHFVINKKVISHVEWWNFTIYHQACDFFAGLSGSSSVFCGSGVSEEWIHSNLQSYFIQICYRRRYRAFVSSSRWRVWTSVVRWQSTKHCGGAWPCCSGWVPSAYSCCHHCVMMVSLRHHYSCQPPGLQQQEDMRMWQMPLPKWSPSKVLGRSEKTRRFSLTQSIPCVPRVSLPSQPLRRTEVPPITLFSLHFSSPEQVWRVICLLVVRKSNITTGFPKVEPCECWSLLQRLTLPQLATEIWNLLRGFHLAMDYHSKDAEPLKSPQTQSLTWQGTLGFNCSLGELNTAYTLPETSKGLVEAAITYPKAFVKE